MAREEYSSCGDVYDDLGICVWVILVPPLSLARVHPPL